MATINVAISTKALVLLNDSGVGLFIKEGVVQPDGSRGIGVVVSDVARLNAMQGHASLRGALVRIVARATGGPPDGAERGAK